jgi:hypothetical protein
MYSKNEQLASKGSGQANRDTKEDAVIEREKEEQRQKERNAPKPGAATPAKKPD